MGAEESLGGGGCVSLHLRCVRDGDVSGRDVAGGSGNGCVGKGDADDVGADGWIARDHGAVWWRREFRDEHFAGVDAGGERGRPDRNYDRADWARDWDSGGEFDLYGDGDCGERNAGADGEGDVLRRGDEFREWLAERCGGGDVLDDDLGGGEGYDHRAVWRG